jgi:hypothetical protein
MWFAHEQSAERLSGANELGRDVVMMVANFESAKGRKPNPELYNA